MTGTYRASPVSYTHLDVYKRQGLAGYFGSLILFAIPLVGLIFMLIWSISDRVRPERRCV